MQAHQVLPKKDEELIFLPNQLFFAVHLKFREDTNPNAVLNGETSDASKDVTVYAVNYNVLRIMSGMGGLAYSN